MIKKSKIGLFITTIFAPILALALGLALLSRPEESTAITIRLQFVNLLVENVFEMDLACRRYLSHLDARSREDWEQAMRNVERIVRSQPRLDANGQRTNEMMTRRLARMRAGFDQLANLASVPDASGGKAVDHGALRDGLESELLRTSRELISDALELVAQHHRMLFTSQQHLDSRIILFGAILASLMAILAYANFRIAMGEEKAMARELDRRNLMLSDAFIKLRRAQQGIELERLQALQEMAGTIGSEIHTHLLPIARISDTMLNYPESLADKERVVNTLKALNTAARKAQNALDRLTLVVKDVKDSIQPNAVQVNELVETALDFGQRKYPGVPVEVKKELGELPMIDGAANDLQEALVQVIGNAYESMPQGGRLSIGTRQEGDEVIVQIADAGAGMTEEVRRHCCEAFFSTKGEAASGMGLTMAASAVRRHHGMLALQSKLNAGTTVSIRLPIRHPLAEAKPGEQSSAQPGHALRVLVVDDQSWVAQTLKALLTVEGHTVVEVASGHAALAQFRKDRFDLVITDRAMPEMDGETLATQIKKIAPRIPVILLTGFGEIIKESGVRSDIVDVVLSKPVTPERLREAIVEAVQKYAG